MGLILNKDDNRCPTVKECNDAFGNNSGGGGISSGFPPAIASILPTIALDSFWAEYYDNSFNPSNWRLKRSLLSLNSNSSKFISEIYRL